MAAVTFDIEYTAQRDRRSSGLRIFYAIPHLILTGTLNSFGEALAVVQWFIILFTGKRNQSLWNLSRDVLNWQSRANSYTGLMYDTYPNFGFERKDEPVTFGLELEEPPDRLTNALRLIWAIPALLLAIFIFIGAIVVTLVSWFAILFTGNHPRGMFNFLLKAHRYGVRLCAYLFLLTDTYPKFE
ncbi:MAG: DUF4389 domain-containing protein [Actinomycetota bacterium]|nr:DUF4389 domain-containing protein [Actinomycetota bacterium]